MKLKNFTFSRGPSGGLDIIVRQNADDSPVIASLHTTEDALYELLASLGLSADEEDDFVFPDDVVEEQDSEE